MRGGRPSKSQSLLSGVVGLVVLLVGAVLTIAAVAGPGQAAEPAPRRILNDIHTDGLYVVFENGRLELKTRVGNAGDFSFHDPSEVIFQLKDTADSRLQVPDIPEFAFLGEPGTPIWVAPQDQIPDLLWPGWATEDASMRPGLFQGDTVDISLIDVAGPGRVEVFRNGPVGQPIRDFSSTDSRFRTLREEVHLHTHANWVFTATGSYTLTFEVAATDVGGNRLTTGPVSFTWYVGGQAATDVSAAPTNTALSVSPQAAPVGDEVTVAASVTPRAAGQVEFFDGTTSLGRQRVRDGKAMLTTSALAAGTHSLTAAYTSEHTNDYLASTSPAVAYTVAEQGATPTPTTTPTTGPTPTSTVAPTTAPTTGPTTAAPPPPSESRSTGSSGNGGSSGGSPGEPKCVPVTGSSGGAGNGGGVAADAVVLDNGHVDYAARIVGGRLQSLVKDGTVAGKTTWREPSKVVFHLKPQAKTTIPAGFGFLGGAGSAIWQIPQTQQQGILWLGWNTEEVSTSQVTGSVSWKLDKVTGPGRLAIYEFNTFGQPRVIFNSGDGLPDSFTVPLGTHAHGNWAFTREGTYKVTFTQTVTLASGGTSTDTEVVTFAVGDVDPATARSLRMTPAAFQPLAHQALSPGRGAERTVTAAACRLPFTGATVLVPAAVGAGLLALGAVAIGVTRRRRRSAPTEE